jgi:hypothetical protein
LINFIILTYAFVFQEEHCSTEAQDTELNKLKQQVNVFKNEMVNSFRPWISDVPQNSELDKYNKLVSELASKVEKINAVSNIHFLKPPINLSYCIPPF